MNFEFPIKNFQERSKGLRWFLTKIPTINGFYCESCLTLFPYTSDGLCVGAIVDRKPSKNSMTHCPGRVLPCCIDCGIKHNIISQDYVNSLTESVLKSNEQAWEKELKEIDTWCGIAYEIAKKLSKTNKSITVCISP